MTRTSVAAARRGTLLTVALLGLAVLLGTSAPPAHAEDTLSWSVAPADGEQGTGRPNFQYALEPGAVVHDGFEVTNQGAQPLTVGLYAADGFTTPEGQLDLLPAGEPSTDLGTWVTLESSEVTLQPGEVVVVPFTLTVPADARPGDHSGGIVTSVSATDQQATVVVDRRLGSRMHVRVAGELTASVGLDDVRVVHHGTADPFRTSSATVTFTVASTGNARSTATATVRLTGPGGAAPVEVQALVPELLPGSTHTQQVEVPGVWPLGRLDAEVSVVPVGVGLVEDAGDTVVGSAATWAVPWAALVVVLVVVGAAVAVPLLRARPRRAVPGSLPGPPSGQPLAAEGRPLS